MASDHWSAQYPAIILLWENAWSEFVFLDYDEIRRVICSTNTIEALNAQLSARGWRPRALPD